MGAQETILNIVENLNQVGEEVWKGRLLNIDTFLGKITILLNNLNTIQVNDSFSGTLEFFRKRFKRLKENKKFDDAWAEEAFTYANILMHRAKLA